MAAGRNSNYSSLFTVFWLILDACTINDVAYGFSHMSSFARRSAAVVPGELSNGFACAKINHSGNRGANGCRSFRCQSGTAMQMNLFDRFTRVTRGTFNDVLKTWEDPEKIMNQALEDMQKDLMKVRQSYAEITATQRRLMKQKEHAEAVAHDWYVRAQLALRSGKEDLAREALARRQVQLEAVAQVDQQLNTQAVATDKLYDGMQELENRIMDAKAKKDQFIARARTAKSTQKVNDMLSGITGKTSMDAFTRMEEKVEALEAAAEVSADMLAKALPASSGKGSSLDQEFRLLEAQSSVEDELQKLKGLLTPAKDSTSVKKPTRTAKAYSSTVNSEFERLKNEFELTSSN